MNKLIVHIIQYHYHGCPTVMDETLVSGTRYGCEVRWYCKVTTVDHWLFGEAVDCPILKQLPILDYTHINISIRVTFQWKSHFLTTDIMFPTPSLSHWLEHLFKQNSSKQSLSSPWQHPGMETQKHIYLCSSVTAYSQYVCYITVVSCNVAITTSYTEEVPFAMEMEPPGAESEFEVSWVM